MRRCSSRGLWVLLLSQLAACSALYPFDEFRFTPDGGALPEDLPSAPDALLDVPVTNDSAPEDASPADAATFDAQDTSDARADAAVDALADATDGARDDGPAEDVATCRGGRIACGGACVDPLNDTNHCGMCGRVCPVHCVNGACLTVTAIQTANTQSEAEGHTCALLSDQTVRCWGSNDTGQLGDNTNNERPRPAAVVGLSNVAQIAVGAFHNCARRTDGTVACWGNNVSRESGSAGGVAVLSATTVAGITNAVGVSAGFNHTCAVLVDGSVRCWGNNTAGQCGLPGGHAALPPTVVTGITQAVEIVAGNRFTCTRREDGSVFCWGAGGSGQLGDGTSMSRLTPTRVPTVIAQRIAVGGEDALAMLMAGQVVCWGANRYGSCGNNTTVASPSPTPSLYRRGIATGLAVGNAHNCYLGPTGLMCAGLNNRGQLGNGTTTNSAALVSVATAALPDAAVSVSCGYENTCAALANGEARCWGRNDQGQLGDGTFTTRPLPTQVVF